jgi:hypothetical protein
VADSSLLKLFNIAYFQRIHLGFQIAPQVKVERHKARIMVAIPLAFEASVRVPAVL